MCHFKSVIKIRYIKGGAIWKSIAVVKIPLLYVCIKVKKIMLLMHKWFVKIK